MVKMESESMFVIQDGESMICDGPLLSHNSVDEEYN